MTSVGTKVNSIPHKSTLHAKFQVFSFIGGHFTEHSGGVRSLCSPPFGKNILKNHGIMFHLDCELKESENHHSSSFKKLGGGGGWWVMGAFGL